MEKYKVNIYSKAQSDLKDIVEYLNTLSSKAAFKYYDLIIERIAELSTLPKRYPLCRDTQLRIKGYRSFPVNNYLVFYCVVNDEVQIRRILYGKRNYKSILE